MRTSRIVAIVFGCLLAIPATGLLVSGVVLGGAYALRGSDGYFDVNLDELETATVAVTAEDIDLRAGPGSPQWVLDAIDPDIRLRVTPLDGSQPVFVGIARERDLDQYLAGVAHDEIRRVDELTAIYRTRTGSSSVAPPADQPFWEESASGLGTQEIVWEATAGRWAVAVMNADGSPGVAADVNVGARSDIVVPVAIGLLAVGAVALLVAVALIVLGGRGLAGEPATAPVAGQAPVAGSSEVGPRPYPLQLEAELDHQLSRWRWLVKWLLAVPHLIVLFFLWIAFAVVTVVAGVAILFGGRYPRSLFDFNVGVLRWSWRTSYYAFSGGLGTDRYPPFSLGPEPDYPARLDVVYPERLSRGLVLVKWWLLAVPHYIVVAILVGGGGSWATDSGTDLGRPASIGLIGFLVLIAAVVLLVTGTYPKPLFDLVIGLNRWVYRVVAYAGLLTDRYPPFRLDQGGAESIPGVPPTPDTPDVGTASAVMEPTAG